MRKIRFVVIFLLIILLVIEGVINFYLFVKKNILLEQYPGSKIKYVFYLFPNKLFLYNVEITLPIGKLYSKNILLNFSVKKIIKGILSLNSFYSDKIFLDIKEISFLTPEEKTAEVQDKIKQLLSYLPLNIRIKKVEIKYKDKFLAIKDVLRKDVEEDKINIVFLIGTEKISSKLNFCSDLTKNVWSLKGEICPFMSRDVTANLHFRGVYDLTQSQDYLLWININNEEKIRISGSFKFMPCEICGKIESKNVEGSFKIYERENKIWIDYNGIVNLFKLFSEVETSVSALVDKDKNYKFVINLANKSFMFNSQVVNGEGKFWFKSKDKIVTGLIKYDNTKHSIFLVSNQKNVPFDLQINFSEKNVILSGSIFDYVIKTFVVINKQNCLARSSISSKTKDIKFEFSTNYSTATAYVKYNNFLSKGNFELNSSVDFSKNVVFNIKASNVELVRNELDCIIDGIVEFDKDGAEYKTVIKNLQVNKTQFVDNMEINGKYKDGLLKFNIKTKDNTISAKGNYNFKIYSYIIEANIKRKNFIISGIKTDLVAMLKIVKDKEFFVSGSYLLENIYLGKQMFLDKLSGNIKNKGNSIMLLGSAINKNKVSPFISVIKTDTGKIEIKIQDFIQSNLTKNMNIEIFSDLHSVTSATKYFTGRVYNENSEIIISSVVVDKNMIRLNGKIKNLNIKNNNFVCNFYCQIVNLQNNIFEILLSFNNLWINDYFVDKILAKCIYNVTKRQIEFVDEKNFSGKIIFGKTNIIFDNFKFVISEKQKLLCNGKMGDNGDVLMINFTKFPIETLLNIFNLSQLDVKGETNGKIEVLSILRNKKVDYRYKTEIFAKNIEVFKVKIDQVNVELSTYKDYLSIKVLDIIFKPDKKISVKGSYNFDTTEFDFLISSYKCDLSIINNLFDVVKTAEGELVMNLHINGKKDKPQVEGSVKITNGRINFNRYGKYLRNINLRLVSEKDKININAIANYEQTKMLLSGYYGLNNSYDFSVKTQGGSGVFVSIPELSLPADKFFGFIKSKEIFVSNGELHFDLRIKKERKNIPFISGNILMNNTYFTYPGEMSYKRIGDFNKVYYDINLVANNNVWYENESLLANIVGKVNFKYSEGMEKSDINGEVDATHGKVNFLNTYFNIKSGNLEIKHREVYLELLAETNIVTQEKEKINVQIIIPRSKIEEIKPKLYCSNYPQLKTEDITALILGVGKIQKYENKVEVISSEKIDVLPLLRTQFIKLIDTTLTTPMVRNILQKWGIADNVIISQVSQDFVSRNVDIEQKEPGSLKLVDIFKNTKYGIEKYITPDMIVGYSISVAELQNKLSLKHEVEISYRLKNNIFIKGVYDYGLKDLATGRYGSDVKIQIEPRFKFKSWAEEETTEKK